ncbi:MAG: bacterial ammonia monooxygenase, subunit AmoB [Pseudomonadota bacterium]|nr:bacterial ammonia monooxygenase, subunit AmoB [Pseudomonadota bacterium]
MEKRLSAGRLALLGLLIVLMQLPVATVYAHGERAQQASLRMRTINWFDVDVYPREVKVNDIVTVKGKFVPSVWWPEHIASIEEASFLNIGVPGPAFVRLDSRVNGVPMIRSTRFELGKTYEFEIKLKARAPGEYHVHPVVSIESAGPVIGPAYWVTVGGTQADFENSITTLTGDTIDLETYGMATIIRWNILWFIIGIAWIAWWFRKMPVIMPRYIQVEELGDDANKLITIPDMIVSFLFFGGVMVLIAGGYMWSSYQYPITTPLQTGKVEVEPLPEPVQLIDVEVGDARYRIPGRSFQIQLTVTNRTDNPIQVGEFSTANIRFINPELLDVKPQDKHDLVASNGLRVDDPPIQPGETRTITVYAEDALWETYRLTSLLYEPDSRFAGMLFFYDSEGRRYYQEIGGAMLPTFL